jgi:hypothetical protein
VCNVSQVATDFRRIDVDRADNPESLALGDLTHDAGANRPEADVQDLDWSRL